jgi:hypothetical protein
MVGVDPVQPALSPAQQERVTNREELHTLFDRCQGNECPAHTRLGRSLFHRIREGRVGGIASLAQARADVCGLSRLKDITDRLDDQAGSQIAGCSPTHTIREHKEMRTARRVDEHVSGILLPFAAA